MAEVAERVARLEERADNESGAIAELKIEIVELRSDMRSGFGNIRSELGEIRTEMSTQFRWIMGGIGGATLTILVAVLAAILAKS